MEGYENIVSPVYRQGSFAVYSGHGGFIITDHSRPFCDAHAHGIRHIGTARQIIDNVQHKRRPDTKNQWLLRSHYRLSPCPEYRQMIEDLMTARKEHRNATRRRN